MQFQEKRINQTQENDKKPHFGLGLGRLGTNVGCQLFFLSNISLRQSLDIMESYHHVKYQKKLIILRKFSEGRTDGQTDGHRDRQRNSQQN